jgi:hypothetical protein
VKLNAALNWDICSGITVASASRFLPWAALAVVGDGSALLVAHRQ